MFMKTPLQPSTMSGRLGKNSTPHSHHQYPSPSTPTMRLFMDTPASHSHHKSSRGNHSPQVNATSVSASNIGSLKSNPASHATIGATNNDYLPSLLLSPQTPFGGSSSGRPPGAIGGSSTIEANSDGFVSGAYSFSPDHTASLNAMQRNMTPLQRQHMKMGGLYTTTSSTNSNTNTSNTNTSNTNTSGSSSNRPRHHLYPAETGTEGSKMSRSPMVSSSSSPWIASTMDQQYVRRRGSGSGIHAQDHQDRLRQRLGGQQSNQVVENRFISERNHPSDLNGALPPPPMVSMLDEDAMLLGSPAYQTKVYDEVPPRTAASFASTAPLLSRNELPSKDPSAPNGSKKPNATAAPFSTFVTNDLDWGSRGEYWITIYGFPIDAMSDVLKEFQKIGEVVRFHHGKGNWIDLQYRTRLQAEAGLSKNGDILLGSIMLGVKRCQKQEKGNTIARGPSTSSVVPPGSVHRRVPPKHYQVQEDDLDIMHAPKRETNICSRIMEWMFYY